MPMPDLYQPGEVAKRLGTSERRVRERARELNACLILGKNRIALTEEDVLAIMESFRCRSRSTRGAKSTTSGARLPDVSLRNTGIKPRGGMNMTTVDDIYAAINPLPAKLNAKGRREPDLKVEIAANAGFTITTTWKKRKATSDWDREYNCFLGDTFEEVLEKVSAFIHDLPSAEQSVLHDFMGQLGRLIDEGRADGIQVDFLNPLIETMKRLSENVITHKQVVA